MVINRICFGNPVQCEMGCPEESFKFDESKSGTGFKESEFDPTAWSTFYEN